MSANNVPDVFLCKPRRKSLWLAKLARSSHEASADGSSGFYLGRDHETNRREYHNRTIHGPIREEQAYLKRRVRDATGVAIWIGRDLDSAKITLNEYLDRWLAANALTVERLCIAAISPAAVSFETSASGCRRTTGINYRLTCGRVGTNPLRGQPFTSPHGSCEFGKEVWGNPAERKSAYRAGAAGSNRNCDIRCANVNRTCCKMWP